jgi:UDP-glucose 4-epimerase
MKILVTGGDGLVGRPLCRFLSQEHDVHVLDCFIFGFEESFYNDLGVAVHRCDIREFDRLQEVVSEVNPDLIFHLAALHFIPECENKPDKAIQINTLGTVNLLRAVKRGARVVIASTAAVYAPDTNPHIEDKSKIMPADIYGFSKLHAEHYVQYFKKLKDIKTTLVRLFNVIGPGETNPHVLPVILDQLLKGKRVISLGNVKPKRDYIFVEDVAEGFAAIGLMDGKAAEKADVLNLGTSKAYSVEEMVAMLSEILGEKITIDVDPERVRKTDRPLLLADINKITNLTGWKPRFSIEQALKATWECPDFRITGLGEIK